MDGVKFRRFWGHDSGAVTVDWVVLTAATVGLALVGIASVRGAAVAGAGGVSDALTSMSVMDLGELGGAGDEACDWVCAFSAFLLAEEPGFNENDFGGTLEDLAQARLDEFNGYSSQILRDHVAGIAPHYQNQPEPYRSYYAAEIDAIRDILAARGEVL